MREASRVHTERAPWDDAVPYPVKFLSYKANIANSAARRFYLAHGSRELEPAFEIKPVQKADLMTCRHCVRAALKLCPQMLKAFPEILQTTERALLRPEPLILINSAGERFEAEFHCKENPCEMTITAIDDLTRKRREKREATPPKATSREEKAVPARKPKARAAGFRSAAESPKRAREGAERTQTKRRR